MRIEMAMENRIAYSLVKIAAAVVHHLQGVACARADHLAVQVARVIAVGRLQPLLSVLMVYVRDVGSAMQYPEDHMVIDVAVIYVRGIIRVKGHGCLLDRRNCEGSRRPGTSRSHGSLLHAIGSIPNIGRTTRSIGRFVHEHCRIADGP